jgi:hypothetical protein
MIAGIKYQSDNATTATPAKCFMTAEKWPWKMAEIIFYGTKI